MQQAGQKGLDHPAEHKVNCGGSPEEMKREKDYNDRPEEDRSNNKTNKCSGVNAGGACTFAH